MKTTVTETMFIESFKESRPENFSCEGLIVLFDYLVELDVIELDVISIYCKWCEYTFEEFSQDYDLPEKEDEDIELKNRIESYLQEKTSIAGFTDSSVVFAAF